MNLQRSTQLKISLKKIEEKKSFAVKPQRKGTTKCRLGNERNHFTDKNVTNRKAWQNVIDSWKTENGSENVVKI